MPTMISLREFRLATLSGHVLIFEARVPREVPELAVQEAMAAGCVLHDPNDAPLFEDNRRPKFDLENDLRESVLYLLCKMLAEENKVQNFDGGGVPREGVLSALAGFEVGKKEVQTVWQAYMTAKSEGREYGIHPDAVNVLQIIQAEGKNDLLDIAKEMDIDLDTLDGKQAKTIRAMLLKTFSGAVLN